MKKILFVCSYSSKYAGNFIYSLICLSKELINKDCECYFVFPNEAKSRTWISCFNYIKDNLFFSNFSVNDKKIIENIDTIINNYKIDILHFHFYDELWINFFSLKHKKLKIFVHLHSDFSKGHISKISFLKKFIRYNFLSFNVRYFGVSEYLCELSPKHISFVPNAIAPGRDDPSFLLKSKKFKNIIGINDAEFLCEIYGWAPDVKGVDLAVEAVKLANEESNNNIKLMIICGEKFNKNRMKEYIKRNTSCSGDEPFLILLDPIGEVFIYHHAADILLSPSRSEAFSYVVLEMLTLGKNCVVSDVQGLKWAACYEVVKSFESENVKDFSKKILASLDNIAPNNLTALKVKKDYSIDSWVKRIISLYEII